jgi:hypothetical protein
MALEMKQEGEKGHQLVPANAMAMICSYESLFAKNASAR